jgi:hypothetical protein
MINSQTGICSFVVRWRRVPNELRVFASRNRRRRSVGRTRGVDVLVGSMEISPRRLAPRLTIGPRLVGPEEYDDRVAVGSGAVDVAGGAIAARVKAVKCVGGSGPRGVLRPRRQDHGMVAGTGATDHGPIAWPDLSVWMKISRPWWQYGQTGGSAGDTGCASGRPSGGATGTCGSSVSGALSCSIRHPGRPEGRTDRGGYLPNPSRPGTRRAPRADSQSEGNQHAPPTIGLTPCNHTLICTIAFASITDGKGCLPAEAASNVASSQKVTAAPPARPAHPTGC